MFKLPIVSLLSCSAFVAVEGNHGYKSSEQWLPRTPVLTMPTGVELMGTRPLPTDFDWRNVNGQSFVTVDWNQHQPVYCGSCWVHGTGSALQDRIKIFRKARFPDVILARQTLMNCVPDPSGQGPPPGCHGGDPFMIHHFMHDHKVPDETCLTYAGVNQECTPLNICRNCFRQLPLDPLDPFKPGPCWGMPTYIGYGVSDYGQMSGEAAMMKEIYARGPIACSGVTTVDFVQNFAVNPGVLKDGVFRDAKQYNESEIDHIMEITGWGETATGTKYWVVRNSWGTYWGVAGWFKLERGTNSLKLEEHCDWAVPDFAELDRDLLHEVQGDYYKGVPGGTANLVNMSTPGSSFSAMPKGVDQLFVDPQQGIVGAGAWATAAGQIQQPRQSEKFATGCVGAIVGGTIVWILPRIFGRSTAMRQPGLLG